MEFAELIVEYFEIKWDSYLVESNSGHKIAVKVQSQNLQNYRFVVLMEKLVDLKGKSGSNSASWRWYEFCQWLVWTSHPDRSSGYHFLLPSFVPKARMAGFLLSSPKGKEDFVVTGYLFGACWESKLSLLLQIQRWGCRAYWRNALISSKWNWERHCSCSEQRAGCNRQFGTWVAFSQPRLGSSYVSYWKLLSVRLSRCLDKCDAQSHARSIVSPKSQFHVKN